jgi:peroxiredoxin
MPFGPEIGTRIPEFQARDQHGTLQTFQTLRGPRGAVLAFVRSADW